MAMRSCYGVKIFLSGQRCCKNVLCVWKLVREAAELHNAVLFAGGQAEHDAVMKLLSDLHPQEWTVCNSRILNRPKAPVLTLAIKALPKH